MHRIRLLGAATFIGSDAEKDLDGVIAGVSMLVMGRVLTRAILTQFESGFLLPRR